MRYCYRIDLFDGDLLSREPRLRAVAGIDEQLESLMLDQVAAASALRCRERSAAGQHSQPHPPRLAGPRRHGAPEPTTPVQHVARGAELFLAEASFVNDVPEESATGLSSARDRGAVAEAAGVRGLVLCHVWPGEDEAALEAAARSTYSGEVSTAGPGLTVDL